MPPTTARKSRAQVRAAAVAAAPGPNAKVACASVGKLHRRLHHHACCPTWCSVLQEAKTPRTSRKAAAPTPAVDKAALLRAAASTPLPPAQQANGAGDEDQEQRRRSSGGARRRLSATPKAATPKGHTRRAAAPGVTGPVFWLLLLTAAAAALAALGVPYCQQRDCHELARNLPELAVEAGTSAAAAARGHAQVAYAAARARALAAADLVQERWQQLVGWAAWEPWWGACSSGHGCSGRACELPPAPVSAVLGECVQCRALGRPTRLCPHPTRDRRSRSWRRCAPAARRPPQTAAPLTPTTRCTPSCRRATSLTRCTSRRSPCWAAAREPSDPPTRWGTAARRRRVGAPRPETCAHISDSWGSRLSCSAPPVLADDPAAPPAAPPPPGHRRAVRVRGGGRLPQRRQGGRRGGGRQPALPAAPGRQAP